MYEDMPSIIFTPKWYIMVIISEGIQHTMANESTYGAFISTQLFLELPDDAEIPHFTR